MTAIPHRETLPLRAPEGGGATGPIAPARGRELPVLMLLYVAALLAADAAALRGASWLARAVDVDPAAGHRLFAVAALAVAAALAERGRIKLTAALESSISLVPIIFCAVLFGPVAAMIVGAASFLGELRPPYLKWAVYTPIRALVGAAAGAAAVAASCLGGDARAIETIVAATVAASVAAAVADLLLAGLTHALRRNGSLVAMLRVAAPPLLLSIPLYAPLVIVLAIVYQRTSPYVLPLFLIPAIAAQRLFVLYHDQRRLTDEVTDWACRLEGAHESFVNALVATLDARDRYTAGHSSKVAVYARDIAEALGLGEDEQRLAYRCGLVHDIGKVGIAPGLLDKPGALTLQERREVERHPVIGERILARIDDNQRVARIVRHHHERIDGCGYPDGLGGDAIPVVARILAVADSYNAMTSERPYREAMPSRVARIRLAQAAGTQLDSDAVAAFERVLAARGEDYRTGVGEEFGDHEPALPPAAVREPTRLTVVSASAR